MTRLLSGLVRSDRLDRTSLDLLRYEIPFSKHICSDRTSSTICVKPHNTDPVAMY